MCPFLANLDCVFKNLHTFYSLIAALFILSVAGLSTKRIQYIHLCHCATVHDDCYELHGFIVSESPHSHEKVDFSSPSISLFIHVSCWF